MSPHPIRTVLLVSPETLPDLCWESTGLPITGARLLAVNPIRPGQQMTGYLVFDDASGEHVLVATPKGGAGG